MEDTTPQWKEVTITLRYHSSILNGGESRCEPNNVKELIQEINRAMNASHFGGLIEIRV